MPLPITKSVFHNFHASSAERIFVQYAGLHSERLDYFSGPTGKAETSPLRAFRCVCLCGDGHKPRAIYMSMNMLVIQLLLFLEIKFDDCCLFLNLGLYCSIVYVFFPIETDFFVQVCIVAVMAE